MRCWCGYLSGARCRLFTYSPADATTVPKPNHLLPRLYPDWLYLSPGCPGKKTVKRVYLLIVGTILPTEEVIRPRCLCACLLLKPVAMDSSAALSERITSDSDSSSIMLETMCCRVVSLSMRRLEMRFSCCSV